MPLKIADLDDRQYADLVEEGIGLIPRYAPSWTNHNAADPGITLLELFAFLSEGLIYQLNRVSDGNKLNFLKLLTGSVPEKLDHEGLQEALRVSVSSLRTATRAVTCDDFEKIAKEATEGDPVDRQVRRAKCFPRSDLQPHTEEEKRRDRPGHTSVIFVPADPWTSDERVGEIKAKLEGYFEPRRILTSRIHVYGPRYVDVEIRVQLLPLSRLTRASFGESLQQEVERFFDPLVGGPEGSGWPWGRSLYTSDIYRLIEKAGGLDYVISVDFAVSSRSRLQLSENGEVVEVRVQPEELLRVTVAGILF